MSVTITQTTGTLAATSTEAHLEAAITASGVYLYRLDLSNIVGGTTPDIYEVREYMKVDGTNERMLEGSPMTFVGGLSPAAIELPTRAIHGDQDYRVTVDKIQGSDRNIPWHRLEIG